MTINYIIKIQDYIFFFQKAIYILSKSTLSTTNNGCFFDFEMAVALIKPVR